MERSKKDFRESYDVEIKDILDSLPIGISIQDRDRIVVYENATMVDWFGSSLGKHCYSRFNYLRSKNEKDTICKDCPGFASLKDNQPHSIIRETKSKQGQDLILEITHYPIRSSFHETPKLYVEMIKNVTSKKLRILETKENDYSILDKMYVGISVFDGMDELNYYLYSDLIPFLNYKEVLPYFYQKLNTYWTQAIGQGHNWQEGLFGPLPFINS